MKKITKNLILSFIALLGLASCGAPEVKPEVAQKRAQKIVETQKEETFELPKKAYLEEIKSLDATETTEGKTVKSNIHYSTIVSLDLDTLQFYLINEKKSVEDGEEKTQTSQAWFYVEDNTFYSASLTDNKKSYSKLSIEGNGDFNFEDAIRESIDSFYKLLTSEDALELTQYSKKITNDLIDEFKLDFGTPTVKYTSTGEGNLGISQKTSVNHEITFNNAKVALKGSATNKIQFDNYLLSSSSSECKLSLSADGEKIEAKLNVSSQVHLNQTQFTKPDLSSFTETGK